MGNRIDKRLKNTHLLKFIDAGLDVFGCISRSDITKAFSVGESTASRAIRDYKEAAPGNIYYCVVDKKYKKKMLFKRAYISPGFDSSDLLRLIDELYKIN